MIPLGPLAPYASAMKIAAAITAVVMVALMGWRVSVWHDAYRALQATEKALERSKAELDQCTADAVIAEQAYTAAAEEAERIAEQDRATAQRIEHELQTRMAAADAGARDLARRLRDHQVSAGRCAVPGAAGTTVELVAAGGEPPDGGTVEQAAGDHFAACARDAERLDGWRSWWAEVARARADDH